MPQFIARELSAYLLKIGRTGVDLMLIWGYFPQCKEQKGKTEPESG